ncbi:MAG: VacJ family lipoprotein [Candidatus Rokubacteria bacterium]|nr:VacJ family lipoprotein [Candidatus Rokubacteria bacterium]
MPRGSLHLLVLLFLAAAITGCGTGSRVLRSASAPVPAADVPSAPSAAPSVADVATDGPAAATAGPEEVVLAATELLGADAADDSDRAPILLAQAPPAAKPPERDEYDVEEYDPWEPFNETMFEFNRKLDRHVLKPVATGYDKVVPDDVQRMISNAFDNLGAPKRMINSLFQGKWDGAMRELARFMVNTTVGMGGLFDMGRAAEIEKSREDFGQTLGFYGAGPGPFLILPLLEPLTVRDGIGKFVDGFMEPLGYFIPFVWEGLVLRLEEIVNDRSLNLELYQGFEETVVDMYSAVRHAYLERRRNLIKE